MVHSLFLMRHGKSDWTARSDDDFSRPLNDRGREDVVRMSHWLINNHHLPDKIICSSAERTCATATIIAKELSKFTELELITDDSLYLCSYHQLLNTIEREMGLCQKLFVVAHNPALDEVVSHLCLEPPAVTATGKLMTTAAIALFHYANGYSPYQGDLDILVRPKEIE